jgi:hypothetical protein
MVEVRLMQRQDRSLYYEVLVRSRVRPDLKAKGIHEFGQDVESTEGQKLGLLAGALAEHLCLQYSDTLEPSNCARAAINAHRELMAENPHVRMGDELPRDADKSIAATVARKR